MSEPVDPTLFDEREAAVLRAELAIAAAGIGTFDWDLETGELDWDDRLCELFGYDISSGGAGFDRSIDGFNARLHPDDLDRVSDLLQAAIDECGDFQVLYRVCRPDGGTRWISARGRTLCGQDGRATRVLGAASDVTDVHTGELTVTRVLESMPAAFIALDRQWRFTYVNGEAERLLAHRRGELIGRSIWAAFPAAPGSDFEAQYRRAVVTGEPVTFVAHYPEPLDAWYQVQAWPTTDGLSVYFLEITANRLATQRADAATGRLDLILRASAEVADALTAETVAARLPALLVPALADGCIVTTLDVHGAPVEVGTWHADDRRRDLLADYARSRVPLLSTVELLRHSLGTGAHLRLTCEQAVEQLPAGRARDLLVELGPAVVVTVPLRGRGHTLGFLTLLFGERRTPVAEDLAAAQEIADRAGLALDNARLYAEQRAVAEHLQRSMLTAPFEPDHAEIVVRYVPAAEATAVGGDWYDAFLQPDGATLLVIGDVAGHDIAAAATMGQLRGLLRGIAATHDDATPASVLAKLDAAMRLLSVDTFATAAIARLEQTAADLAHERVRLRWSSAGHLPPVLIDADGTVRVLEQDRVDIALGVAPERPRHDSELLVERGATLLLFTDGLIERRDTDLDAGVDRLRTALRDLADRPLVELCDELIARLVDGRPDDDVALVAVRLHPHDRPRPPEAGPQLIPPAVPPTPVN